MENPTVTELRSRSRSKTPFLRSSCDRENCTEGEGHSHHSGRKTPVKRSTPIKQVLNPSSKKNTTETIVEEDEHGSPPAHRTRKSLRNIAAGTATENHIKTSDYSSEESLDRLKGNQKEIVQNEINSRYEHVASTISRRYITLGDVALSPVHLTNDRSTRFGSPAYSGCSTDSSFAEQTLADVSALLDKDPDTEHLPYKLYKMAGEYWNKYPKTDYTYSRLSKDRVELAPGQVAVPNMSRRSLSQFRVHGPNTSADELDRHASVSAWTSSIVQRKRYTAVDSSDDESSYLHKNGDYRAEKRWWIVRLLITIITTLTTTTSKTWRKLVGPSHRYPYTERNSVQASITSRVASAAMAPVYWIYSIIKKVVTTTVTTVTETIKPNSVMENETHSVYRYERDTTKRRWWPWLLLLLLPFVGYGCYYSSALLPQEQVMVDTYKPPLIVQDSDLSKRVAALEDWALNVDSKLNSFDRKLTKLDNFEAQIEQYSLKYLQNNLIQVFNMDNSEAVAVKLKQYFDNLYVNKEQFESMSKDIHERLINSWKPEMDDDKIRQIIQDYLAVFERRQMQLIIERVKEQVKEIKMRYFKSEFDVEAIKKVVSSMLDIYDADKTGIVDYALENAGGQVISTKCTELYQIKTKQYSVLGLPVWWAYTSPRNALTAGAQPAECWAFQGFPGYLVIRLFAIIEVTGFSVEHMSRLLAVEGKIESAPKNFSVYGLHGELDPDPHLFGNYMYDANGTAIQYFPVKYPKTTNIGGVNYPVAYDIVELRVESNHGNPTYTCVYRFRVHGNPLSDIRKATEDNMRE